MAAKANTNVLKLSAIFCCARQTIDAMLSDNVAQKTGFLDFTVTLDDVKNSWNLVDYSIYQYTQFKV